MSGHGGPPVRLALSDSREEAGHAAPWIGPLLALGTRAARYSKHHSRRQLIIAVSVPRRDFAAALIGCGWVLASEAPTLPTPLEALRAMEPGTPVRAVNSRHVVTGSFSALNEATNPPRARFAGSTWQIEGIRALAALCEPEQPARDLRPEPGSIEHMAHLDITWDARLALPTADLAIVGTMKWLAEDFEAYVSRPGDGLRPSCIRSLLLPDFGRPATWYTRVYASSRFAEQLPLPKEVRCALLDGRGAINYLAEIEASAVICVLDRSVADETAAEMIVQLRNTRGEPFSLRQDLEWFPPAGVEALAFTVAL